MIRIAIFSMIVGAALAPLFAFAFEATSTSFKLIDPVFTITGGFATSTTYRLNEAVAQPAIATSSSPTSFRVSSGFLYFPFVTKPTVSATAGDGSVVFSWTASQGFLGWIVSGYNVGQAVISGGPYVYSASLGNVLSSTRSGLSNGTTYYFVVRAEDALGNSIATSSEVSATPVAGPVVSSAPVSVGSDGAGIIKNFLISLIAALHEPLVPCVGGTTGDLNCDKKVGLQDLSILLSRAEAVSITDISILFSHWTEPLLTFVSESSRFVLPRAVEKVIAPEKQMASVGSAAGLFETTTAAVSKKEGQATSSLVMRVRMITQPLDRAVFFAVGLVKALWNVLLSIFFSLFKKQ
ncbi:fibronectin type III domain-containing protein [Patescibacteria group bacterium]|nr:fibronectin type III domain-containing protein [Patescibacteria group bacterium]